VYGADTPLGDARWDRGYGGGLFLAVTVFSMRLDVAHGRGGGNRAHFTLGVSF
jgi:hypothetical protein